MCFFWLELAGFPAHPVELLAAIMATILLGFGLGVTGMILRSLWSVCGTIDNLWSVCGTIDNMMAHVLFFISGIFLSVEYLPLMFRDILVWNPLVHAIEWLRYAIYPEYFTQILDRAYLLT